MTLTEEVFPMFESPAAELEGRRAGAKGGRVVSRDRDYMRSLDRKGGQGRAQNRELSSKKAPSIAIYKALRKPPRRRGGGGAAAGGVGVPAPTGLPRINKAHPTAAFGVDSPPAAVSGSHFSSGDLQSQMIAEEALGQNVPPLPQGLPAGAAGAFGIGPVGQPGQCTIGPKCIWHSGG
jgi:hypothetical protein